MTDDWWLFDLGRRLYL